MSADQVVQSLRKKIAAVPGIRVYLQNPLPSTSGALHKSHVPVHPAEPSTEELLFLCAEAGAPAEGSPPSPGCHIRPSDQESRSQREDQPGQGLLLGLSASQIEESLYSAYGTRQISQIYAPNDQYLVILELKPEYQMDPSTLSLLFLKSSQGELVPLSTVASLTQDVGPLSVNHSGQLPSVTISFNLKPGVSLGDAVAQVDRIAKETLPDSITTGFQGTAQAFQASMEGARMLLILAILVIYIVLGILYESFIHPLTILSALPLAGFGALLTLFIFNVELSIYAFVGSSCWWDWSRRTESS